MVVVVGAQSESSTTEVVGAYIYASFLHLHISLHLELKKILTTALKASC